ncbi:MAG: peptide-methionine (R)-S-oxide reductase MsrB [Myxococcota bacterium]
MSRDPREMTEADWKALLTPEQFRVLRKHGTERAWTGTYNDEKRRGTYVCAGCGHPLFSSEDKYDSGSGWPSYTQPMQQGAVGEKQDWSLFMRRTEVHCANCRGHLGHVFPDGPGPSGLRYCVNSVSLAFTPEDAEE